MEKPLDSLSKVLGLVTVGLSIWITIKTNQVDEKVKAIGENQKILEYVHDSLKFERDFKTQIYADVKDAIKSNNDQIQRASKEYVINMVSDQKFLEAMLSVLAVSSKSPELKEEIKTNLVNQAINQTEDSALVQHLALKTKHLNLKNLQASANVSADLIDIEVFYCEETHATSKQKAEKIVALLKASKKFNVRPLRILSEIKNAGTGYNIKSNVIRYTANDSYNETRYALEIQKMLAAENIDITTLTVDYPTPWYLSVFIY